MRHLKHKTADLILSHDYDGGPLRLFGGYSDEWESLIHYVNQVAKARKIRLSVKFPLGFNQEVIIATIRKVV